MSLKKIRTEVTYKVPAWNYCNHQGTITGKPAKDMCRFCVKEKGYHRCALHNIILDTTDGTLVVKTRQCIRATAGFSSVVEDNNNVPDIDPKLIMKSTIKEYDKLRKQLLSQGYTTALAEKIATEHLLGGN